MIQCKQEDCENLAMWTNTRLGAQCNYHHWQNTCICSDLYPDRPECPVCGNGDTSHDAYEWWVKTGERWPRKEIAE